MRITLRILSALLRYPDADMQAAAPEFQTLLHDDGVLNSAQIAALAPLIHHISGTDLLDVQDDYVSLFDRGRAHSLHLFEHVHGESRDRGQAMVDLRDRYEAQGLEIAAHELPDYLPMFLEYLSTLPETQACEELAQPGLIIAALAERLKERESLWAAPMTVLRDLAAVDVDTFANGAPEIAPADNPDDLAALDAAWAEEQVRFEAPAAPGAPEDCPQAAALVARFAPPAADRISSHG
ncbi:MAG TPA: nitrate reductase molybdenum cofactor assembly chaperone [Chakrabartia sp.]|nr:nitrate reductase molybdenum cofactor assembly chaperone [Chakrabartia sp.]